MKSPERVWWSTRGPGTGLGTLQEIWDKWGVPFEGPTRVKRSFGRSGMVRRNLLVIRDGLGTILEVRVGSRDP